MKRKVTWVVAVALCAALLVTSCAAPEPEEIGTIKMGVITPLSGFGATWGIPHLQGFELAFDVINERGGVVVDGKRYHFEPVGYDSKLDAAETLTAATRLVYEDGVKYWSVLIDVAPIRDLGRDEGILQLNLSWSYEAINPDYPLMFHYLQTAAQTASVLWTWMDNNTDVHRIVGIGPDYHVGYMGQEINKRAVEYYGMEKIATFYFDPTAADFSAILIDVLEEDPDDIAMDGTPATQMAIIIKQARELGYTGMFTNQGDGAAGMPEMADVAGVENMAGFIAWGGPKEEKNYTPAMIDWEERWLQKYGEPFWSTSFDWSMGAFALYDGIKAANSLEPADIAAAFHSPDFVGENVWGPYEWGGKDLYGIDNVILAPVSFYEWREGGKVYDLPIMYPDEYMPIAADMGMTGMWK